MRILVRIFALIGFLTVLVSLSGWATLLLKRPHLPDTIVLKADLASPLAENATGDNPVELVLNGGSQSSNLRDAIAALDRARHDNRVKGFIMRIGATNSLAQTEELRAAIGRFRASGKFAYVFATSFGDMEPDDRGYYLASAFEQIWLQPVGTVGLSIPMAESPFFRDLLDKWGIKPEFAKRKEYKTAFDPLTEKGFTPANEEEMQNLLGDLERQVIEGISKGRNLPPDTVHGLLANGPYTADIALKDKLVDHLGYQDELIKMARDKAGPGAKTVDWMDYLRVPESRQIRDALPKPAPRNKTVALIYGLGEIHEGRTDISKMTGGLAMGSDTIVEAFDQAIQDKHIKAIIFRIDSPGGSPVASESVRRAVVAARQAGKFVIVSMGELAGSGGYWIATDADRIIADPATLTGSIGVIAGKIAVRDALSKWDVSFASVAPQGEKADTGNFWSMVDPYTPEGRAKLESLTDSMYQDFVTRVAQGRKMPVDKVESIAKGRVWTGDEGVRLGLVDETGGLDTAFVRAREMLKLPADTPLNAVILPAEPSRAERISKLLKMVSSSRIDILPALADMIPGIGKWLTPMLSFLTQPMGAEAARMQPVVLF